MNYQKYLFYFFSFLSLALQAQYAQTDINTAFEIALKTTEKKEFNTAIQVLRNALKKNPSITMQQTNFMTRFLGRSSGITPLKIAILRIPIIFKEPNEINASFTHVSLLLEAGADPMFNPQSYFTPTEFKNDPLTMAILNKNLSALAVLVEDNRTPLNSIIAAQNFLKKSKKLFEVGGAQTIELDKNYTDMQKILKEQITRRFPLKKRIISFKPEQTAQQMPPNHITLWLGSIKAWFAQKMNYFSKK